MEKRVISYLRVKTLTYSHLWVKSYPDKPQGCFTPFPRSSLYVPGSSTAYLMNAQNSEEKKVDWSSWVTWRSVEITAAQRLPITDSFKWTFASRKQDDSVTAKQDRTESIIIWSKNKHNRTINNSALLTYQSKCTTGSSGETPDPRINSSGQRNNGRKLFFVYWTEI